MNEGKGDMMRLAIAFNNGSVSEKLLKEICKDNNWEYQLDNDSCIIMSKVGR